MIAFSKLDKEVLAILIVIVVALLLIGFTVYKYMTGQVTKVQNLTGGVQTEQKYK